MIGTAFRMVIEGKRDAEQVVFEQPNSVAVSLTNQLLRLSLACYTTLGFGDVYATSDLRIIAGLEGLNGLVLIAWSASLTFLAVKPTWDDNGG